MKISYNWLKNYVPELPVPEKVADVFTFHICEIEDSEKLPNSDTIFDIKVLPDRAHDLLSHRGVAKDLAGVLDLEYKNIEYKTPEGNRTKLEIKIETDKCRRYVGRIIRGVKVGPSPEWVRNYLESLGQRSINNIVDATNIVMFDLGQPIHAFDLSKLPDEKIFVKDATSLSNETVSMETLDGKVCKLSKDNMVIASSNNILAIAGVKGGKKAEVDLDTKDILIEVANFDPTSVRKTAKAVNIYTDAVKRFENDLSPLVASDAMNEITALILEMCPEAKLEEVVDVYPKEVEKKKVKFSLSKVSRILGMEISIDQAKQVLDRFSYTYEQGGDIFEMDVPFNRPDLSTTEDMAEEIGRAIGYDKIEAKLPGLSLVPEADETFKNISLTRNYFLNAGYSEVMNYAFCDKGEVEVLASASDKRFLRANLINGMKESLKLNKLNAPFLGMKEIKIFEIGTVFFKDHEEMHVAWNEKNEIKEMLLDDFVSEKFSLELSSKNFGAFALGDNRTGNQHDTLNYLPKASSFKMWSLYPFISRDVAVWMPEGENSEKLEKILKDNSTALLVKGPYLFDSFTKDGKTSYAYRLVFQAYDRTLTDLEISKIMENINQKIAENKDWQIR